MTAATAQTWAQEQLYLGLQVGKVAHFMRIVGESSEALHEPGFRMPFFQIEARLELPENRGLVHLNFSPTSHSFLFRHSDLPEPVRFGYRPTYNFGLGYSRRIPVWRKQLFLSPYCGIQLSGIEGWPAGEMMLFSQASDPSIINGAVLPEAFGDWVTLYASLGLSLEFRLPLNLLLSVQIRYHLGIREQIYTGKINYRVYGQGLVSHRYYSRGNYLPVTLGLSYPISRIWEGKIEIE